MASSTWRSSHTYAQGGNKGKLERNVRTLVDKKDRGTDKHPQNNPTRSRVRASLSIPLLTSIVPLLSLSKAKKASLQPSISSWVKTIACFYINGRKLLKFGSGVGPVRTSGIRKYFGRSLIFFAGDLSINAQPRRTNRYRAAKNATKNHWIYLF